MMLSRLGDAGSGAPSRASLQRMQAANRSTIGFVPQVAEKAQPTLK